MTSFPSPAPVPDHESAPFWDGCRQHRLLVRVCRSCDRAHYPPGPICPWCASRDVEWRQAAGEGLVHSFVVFEHPFVPELAGCLPYTVLRVRLMDWPDAVLYGRLAGAAPGVARLDLAVEVAWEDRPDGFTLPCWQPLAGRS